MLIEMLPPGAEMLAREKLRPLKRVEYDRLVSEGYFENERVELLFGMVVEMPPPSPEHVESVRRAHWLLARMLEGRAHVSAQSPYAASDDSEPEPDVFVAPNGDYWHHHPERAFLVIEVAESSLDRDRGPKRLLYASGHVDEYWIVNHDDRVVEVYRDAAAGTWRSVATYKPGDSIAMQAFPDVQLAVADVLPPA